MDISIYFDPVKIKGGFGTGSQRKVGDGIITYNEANRFPDLEGIDIAIIGVNEDRNAVGNEGCGGAPDMIRPELYNLFQGNFKAKIVDLGNILRGHNISDTYFALASAMAELLSRDIVPIILGGGNDLVFGQYKAYEKIGRIINIASVDPQFDLGNSEEQMDSRSYLSKIIVSQPNYLFNYTNLGYQTYFTDPEAISLMDNLYFDTYRLGFVQHKLDEVEPVVRNADMISIDISAVRMSDAPGNGNAIPNGFYGEELCKIAHYAGMSDKLSSIGFYEYNPRLDRHRQTAQLISQMIWYFLEGFYNRQQDFPREEESGYLKFTVAMQDFKEGIVFYKSKKSERWWMKVPIKKKDRLKYERHYMIPCSYEDYKSACDNNLPDRWWQAYQKLT